MSKKTGAIGTNEMANKNTETNTNSTINANLLDENYNVYGIQQGVKRKRGDPALDVKSQDVNFVKNPQLLVGCRVIDKFGDNCLYTGEIVKATNLDVQVRWDCNNFEENSKYSIEAAIGAVYKYKKVLEESWI